MSNFAVKIWHNDNSWTIRDDMVNADREVVTTWANACAAVMEDCKLAEVVRYYTEEEKSEIRERYHNACCKKEPTDQNTSVVAMRQTVDIVSKVISSSDLPKKARIAKLVEHPAFQLLHHDRQKAIVDSGNYEQMRFLAAQMLSAVAVALGLEALQHRAPETLWRSVIADCNAILFAPPALEKSTRAEIESRRAANRAKRLAESPVKGAGKGGSSSKRTTSVKAAK